MPWRRRGRGAVLAAGGGEAADQFGAQVFGLDDVVDDEFGGQAQDVDVLLVLAPEPAGLGRPGGVVG